MNAVVPIIWTGDLDDDCHAQFGKWHAHAEAMGDNHWYCSVYTVKEREGPDGFGKYVDEFIFHSTEQDLLPITGESARALCELVMRAAEREIFWRSFVTTPTHSTPPHPGTPGDSDA